MKKVPVGLRVLICIFITMISCVILLTATAMIPRDMIHKNSEKSAEYFSKVDPFPVLIGNYVNSMQDNYSDTVLLDIIYCVDTNSPFASVINAKFSQKESENAFEGYLAAVKEQRQPNQEYGRYWHGTSVILRPLLILMPITSIRILLGAIACLIQLAICAVFLKKREIGFGISYLLAFICIEPWMLFVSLEYSTAFVAASVAELMILLKKNKEKDADTMPFFAAVGATTFFVDFLTTETMTFTLPMLLLLIIRAGNTDALNGRVKDKRTQILEGILSVVKNGICWILGYAGMFVCKMLMLLIVSGGEAVKSSLAEGALRLGGEVHISNISSSDTVDGVSRLSGAIWHNLACLYPTTTGQMLAYKAWVPTLIILAVGFSLVYLFHKNINHAFFIPAMIVAMIPILRFLVLSNHSYIHFFITYRALMVTLAVFYLYVYENVIRQQKINSR